MMSLGGALGAVLVAHRRAARAARAISSSASPWSCSARSSPCACAASRSWGVLAVLVAHDRPRGKGRPRLHERHPGDGARFLRRGAHRRPLEPGAVPLDVPRRDHARRPASRRFVPQHARRLFQPRFGLRPRSSPRCARCSPKKPLNVGVIGLGAGVIAAWMKPGDALTFYEISPRVVDIARREFTFLQTPRRRPSSSWATAACRSSASRPRGYDVLGIDAFSGDSIPMHLVTREAMALYVKHLKPDGVIVFQATNRFIDLLPVVKRLAAEFGLEAVNISDSPDAEDGPEYWYSSTDQVIVTRNRKLLEWPAHRRGRRADRGAQGSSRFHRRASQSAADPEMSGNRESHPEAGRRLHRQAVLRQPGRGGPRRRGRSRPRTCSASPAGPTFPRPRSCCPRPRRTTACASSRRSTSCPSPATRPSAARTRRSNPASWRRRSSSGRNAAPGSST